MHESTAMPTGGALSAPAVSAKATAPSDTGATRRPRVDVDQYICQAPKEYGGRTLICGRIGCPGARLRRLCNNHDPTTYITKEQNAERQRIRQAYSRKRKREDICRPALAHITNSDPSVYMSGGDPISQNFFPCLENDCFSDVSVPAALPMPNISTERRRKRVSINESVCQARYIVDGKEMICGQVGCPGAMLRRLCKNKNPDTYMTMEEAAERRRRRQAEARRRKRDELKSATTSRIPLPEADAGMPRLDMPAGLCGAVMPQMLHQPSPRPFEEAVDARVLDISPPSLPSASTASNASATSASTTPIPSPSRGMEQKQQMPNISHPVWNFPGLSAPDPSSYRLLMLPSDQMQLPMLDMNPLHTSVPGPPSTQRNVLMGLPSYSQVKTPASSPISSSVSSSGLKRSKPRVSIQLSVCQAEYNVDGKRMLCGRVGCPGAKMRRLCNNRDISSYVTLEMNAERKRRRQANARKEKRDAAKAIQAENCGLRGEADCDYSPLVALATTCSPIAHART